MSRSDKRLAVLIAGISIASWSGVHPFHANQEEE
jgi:hypothetical protein